MRGCEYRTPVQAISTVMPAQAGIQGLDRVVRRVDWIPAFAGMTNPCYIRQKPTPERGHPLLQRPAGHCRRSTRYYLVDGVRVS